MEFVDDEDPEAGTFDVTNPSLTRARLDRAEAKKLSTRSSINQCNLYETDFDQEVQFVVSEDIKNVLSKPQANARSFSSAARSSTGETEITDSVINGSVIWKQSTGLSSSSSFSDDDENFAPPSSPTATAVPKAPGGDADDVRRPLARDSRLGCMSRDSLDAESPGGGVRFPQQVNSPTETYETGSRMLMTSPLAEKTKSTLASVHSQSSAVLETSPIIPASLVDPAGRPPHDTSGVDEGEEGKNPAGGRGGVGDGLVAVIETSDVHPVPDTSSGDVLPSPSPCGDDAVSPENPSAPFPPPLRDSEPAGKGDDGAISSSPSGSGDGGRDSHSVFVGARINAAADVAGTGVRSARRWMSPTFSSSSGFTTVGQQELPELHPENGNDDSSTSTTRRNRPVIAEGQFTTVGVPPEVSSTDLTSPAAVPSAVEAETKTAAAVAAEEVASAMAAIEAAVARSSQPTAFPCHSPMVPINGSVFQETQRADLGDNEHDSSQEGDPEDVPGVAISSSSGPMPVTNRPTTVEWDSSRSTAGTPPPPPEVCSTDLMSTSAFYAAEAAAEAEAEAAAAAAMAAMEAVVVRSLQPVGSLISPMGTSTDGTFSEAQPDARGGDDMCYSPDCDYQDVNTGYRRTTSGFLSQYSFGGSTVEATSPAAAASAMASRIADEVMTSPRSISPPGSESDEGKPAVERPGSLHGLFF